MRCLRIYATPDGESHFGEVHASVLFTSPPGWLKLAFTHHRVDSSPYGWTATWNSRRAMER
jgi:hypothetical protein